MTFNLPITIEQYQQITPVINLTVNKTGKQISYYTPSAETVWRVETLASKEPDTINWINSFEDNDVLVDIGANVGMYTIFSAGIHNMKVYAFEPESQNFAVLNKNIAINQFQDRVIAYPIALSNETKFDKLYLSQFNTGGSCHSFGEEVDFNLIERKSPFVQGAFATTLDKLVEDGIIPVPTHIKIDVDGFEHKVIEGAKQTLANPILKSILIEINTNLQQHMELVNYMLSQGFAYNEEETMQYMRKEGAFKGCSNFIFKRK